MSFWSNAPLGLFIFHNVFRNVNMYNINSSESCYNSSMRYLSYENVYVVKGLCVGLGDEVEEVGPADCELQTVSGALECPHHTGWAQPEGERPHPLPPDGQECGGEVRAHTHTHTHTPSLPAWIQLLSTLHICWCRLLLSVLLLVAYIQKNTKHAFRTQYLTVFLQLWVWRETLCCHVFLTSN